MWRLPFGSRLGRRHGGAGRIVACLAWPLCSACDATGPADRAPSYVIESYQVAGDALGPVRISRTAAISATYDPESLAVRGAAVRVHLLREDRTIAHTYDYVPIEDPPGIYAFPGPGVVQPRRTYALEVLLADGTRLTARTTVPDTFSIVLAPADTLVYQGAEQFRFVLTQSFYPGRQNIFVFSVGSLDPRLDSLTPFYRALVNENHPDQDLRDLATIESPPVFQGNYDTNPDGTLTIRLPWFAVAFFGPNRVAVNAIDDNLYDFIRSHDVQRRFSTLLPGEVPNVLDHVEGGTGVFGSFARVARDVYVQRPE